MLTGHDERRAAISQRRFLSECGGGILATFPAVVVRMALNFERLEKQPHER